MLHIIYVIGGRMVISIEFRIVIMTAFSSEVKNKVNKTMFCSE